MNDYQLDTELAKKISMGDNLAWNLFVDNYSDYIISNIVTWCKSTCRIFTDKKDCVVESLKNHKQLQDNSNACEEGMELYLYIFLALKNKVVKYQGKSSLKTYITACLRFIYNDYFISKYGKINIPTALKDLDDQSKKIYKILCRSSNLESAYEKSDSLNISKSEFDESYNLIVKLLKEDGNEKLWQHLFSQFSKNKSVTTIDYVNKDGEESEYLLPVEDKDIVNSELIQVFSNCFQKLESKQKRLLKLKFKDDKSIKEIFSQYADLFKFTKEQEVYSEIDKSIKNLLNEIKINYQITGESDIKEFKESLYDIFQIALV